MRWFLKSRREPKKWSTDRVKRRFDAAAFEFQQLDQGQKEIVDASLMRDLIADAALRCCPEPASILDLGCGGGLYAAALLARSPSLKVTISDLSRNMLDCAAARLLPMTSTPVEALHGDVREIAFGGEEFDIITAGAVLHHLRDDCEWESVFAKLYNALRPKGSLWIADIVDYNSEPVKELMRERYSSFLSDVKDKRYADRMLKFIDKEDSPRPLLYQIELLKRVGFREVEVLHTNTCFAAFGAIK